MNMPKRASCHHFMRRSRSAGSPVCGGSFCGGVNCADTLKGSAATPAAVAAPANHSRRVNPSFIAAPRYKFLLLVQTENLLHRQPLLTRFGFPKRLLKAPHQFFPFADLRIRGIGARLSVR